MLILNSVVHFYIVVLQFTGSVFCSCHIFGFLFYIAALCYSEMRNQMSTVSKVNIFYLLPKILVDQTGTTIDWCLSRWLIECGPCRSLVSQDPQLIMSACEFVVDVMLFDFPAEIFLQRPLIVKVSALAIEASVQLWTSLMCCIVINIHVCLKFLRNCNCYIFAFAVELSQY